MVPNALIPVQTMMPALIKRLGGGDVLIGTWPVVVYLAYFLPQVSSANYSVRSQYRKSMVVKFGFIQRLDILLLACMIALWGASAPTLSLALLFLIYISNQATSGTISPIWMDFLAKTTSPERRGKILGWRVSLAAMLALANSLILTAMLTILRFPYNYASAIGLAFLFQMGSLAAQYKVVEEKPSPVSAPVHLCRFVLPLAVNCCRQSYLQKISHCIGLIDIQFFVSRILHHCSYEADQSFRLYHWHFYNLYDSRANYERCNIGLACRYKRN